jgi:zinc/manganese transport system substrate-binding protein
MRMLLFSPLAVLLLAASLACSDSDSDGGDATGAGGIAVVATTTQIGDFARNVGGDRISLTVLLSANQDAHDFELEPSQIRAVAEADLVLRNGLELDAFLDKALEGSNATVATLATGIETQEGGHAAHDEDEEEEHEGEEHEAETAEPGEEEHEGIDPHVWFSVANAHHMVENLRDALIAADDDNADFYRDNAKSYLAQLDSLDTEIRAAVEGVPEQCRKLVTNHDVLGYYATSYGFEVVGAVIPSVSSDAQASAADVADIVRLIETEGVPAIFAEASINPALIQQVGRESGVTVVDDLYGDSLGAAGSDGATYIEMMRANTQKITGALKDCDAA